jgi:dethiobiotin synthetase
MTLLVEGAGGLLCRLKAQTYLDFILAAGLPVLDRAGNKMGCINHTPVERGALLGGGAE